MKTLTKWRMFWGGKWCAVTNMYDSNRTATTLPTRATTAVLYSPGAAQGDWVATIVAPGDIVLDPDHRTTDWDTDY